MKSDRRRSGFTLIELLVVIAIIAILAAILFPVFAQAKTAAKKTVMVSNMKQNALAVMMYADNFDDIVPPRARLNYGPGNGNSDPTNGMSWELLVMPYTKSYAMFTVGEDPKPKYATPYGQVRRGLAAAGNVFISLQNSRGAATRSSRSLAGLPEPSGTVMLGMRFMNNRTTAKYFESADWATEAVMENTRQTGMPSTDDRSPYGQVENIYTGGSVFAFCDGSVRFVKMNGFAKVDNKGYPMGTVFPGYEQRAGWWVKSLGFPRWDSGISCTDATPGTNAADIATDCAVPGEDPRVK